jgi:hypothetical protein
LSLKRVVLTEFAGGQFEALVWEGDDVGKMNIFMAQDLLVR